MQYSRKEDYLHIRWAHAVKSRDFFTCDICGGKGELHSHHLNAYNLFPDERYDISNGVTLCVEHHDMFHGIYGKGDNTALQFEEFRLTLSTIEKMISKQSMYERAAREVLKLLESGKEPEDLEKDKKDDEFPIVQVCTA